MLLPGNGNEVTGVPGVPKEIISGDRFHLAHTFEIKYADKTITSKNVNEK